MLADLNMVAFVKRVNVVVLALSFLWLTVQANQTPLSYLEISLKVQPVDDFCGAKQCNITYSISLLSAVIGSVFGSQTILLLDGTMLKRIDHNGNHFFEDNSIVPLFREMQQPHDEKQVYLGIRFFELPEDIQEYIVVDVTDVAIHANRRVRMQFSTETVLMKVHIYKRHEALHSDELDNRVEELSPRLDNSLVISPHSRSTHGSTNANACACVAKECACCEHVAMKVIHLNDTACVNVSYVSEDVGLRLTLEVDSHVYYSKELSVRNPPPMCFEVPHLRDYASLCLKLYNVEVTEKSITGCTKLEAKFYHLIVASKRLGCFNILL